MKHDRLSGINNNTRLKPLLTISVIILFFLLLAVLDNTLDPYVIRVLNLCAIYIILAVSLNLINGFTGQFALGHAGFMAVGAYTCALLTMTPEMKQLNYFLKPIIPILANVQWPFLPAILLSGIMAAIAGLLVGAPVLRLRGDYLAIATLGFSEIIRIIFTNTQSLTNGSLGLKGLPTPSGIIYWTWGCAIVTIIFVSLFINSSYGRAVKAIREDETAAQAMGIGLFKHKMLSFAISSFLAGIGGALLGNLLGTIDPLMFRFLLTFNILLIVVLGGMGSITGSVISAVVVTSLMEIMRFLDEGFLGIPAVPGLRMVVFSALLMLVILFYPKGIMGNKEITWDFIFSLIKRLKPGKREVKE